MERYAKASIQAQTSLTVLNTGQALIMAAGLGVVMALSAVGIMRGQVTVGGLTMATGYLVALQMPLNFLGTAYREITQSLVDMDAMFRLLHQPQEVKDKPGATDLVVAGGEIKFENVIFAYDPERIVLKGISFTVPAGKTSRWSVRQALENRRFPAFSIGSMTSRKPCDHRRTGHPRCYAGEPA